MQNNRRQFLGSLARGLLLPVGGGALTLADPAKAADLQITQGPLPLSADAVRLRSLKRDLRRMYETQGDFTTVAAYSAAYHSLMVDEVQRRSPTHQWPDLLGTGPLVSEGLQNANATLPRGCTGRTLAR